MSQNVELVTILHRILKDSNLVLQLLSDKNVTESNYKQIAFDTDTTTGSVIEGLFELREHLTEAIEQFDI